MPYLSSCTIFNNKFQVFFPEVIEHVSLITIWGCKCKFETFNTKKSYLFFLPLEKTINIFQMYSINNLSCNKCKDPFISFDYIPLRQINGWKKHLSKNKLIIYEKEDIKKLITNFEFNSIDFING